MSQNDYEFQYKLLVFMFLGFFTSTIILSILENEINPHTAENYSASQFYFNTPIVEVGTASISPSASVSPSGSPSPSEEG